MYPIIAAWVEKSKGRRQCTMEEYRDISFNSKLLEIEHFKHYPQMIPFVGKNYKETKLLVIAESHYLPPKTEYFDPKKLSDAWYGYGTNPIPETWNDHNNGLVNLKDQVDSFNSENYENKPYPKENCYCWVDYTWTAKIIAAVEWNYKGGHRIYFSLKDVLKKERLVNCAFMNFFQRPVPASKEGVSMKNFIIKEDIEVAGDTLQRVCEILKPDKIFFASSCAWDNFNIYINKKGLRSGCSDNSWQVIKMKDCFNSAIVGHGAHPTCPWWNRKSKNYTKDKNSKDNNTGRQAFEYFISKDFKF